MRDTIRFPWPLGDMPVIDFGSPVVNGSNVQGTSLPLRGLTPSATIEEGRPFSIIHSGKSYLHELAAEATVSGTGTATLTIEPPLRAILSDGDVAEFEAPVIDGIIEAPTFPWSLDLARDFGISFTLLEPN
jgi:hypothetical protein